MSHAELTASNQTVMPTATRPVVGARELEGRPLQRLAEVRRQQGVSLRRVARSVRTDLREIKRMEDPQADMPLSMLYRWQRALDVPVADLLVDDDAPLSSPVMDRARLVKLMKTAAAIQEKADSPSVKRLADTLVSQLVEIMPELEGVAPWHAVGQRRTLEELGRAVERGMSLELWHES